MNFYKKMTVLLLALFNLNVYADKLYNVEITCSSNYGFILGNSGNNFNVQQAELFAKSDISMQINNLQSRYPDLQVFGCTKRVTSI